MDAEGSRTEPLCPHCHQGVAPGASVCPQCRNATLTDVRVEEAVNDGRTRYQTARALAAVLPPGFDFAAAQTALGVRGGRVLTRALPGVAAACVAVLTERGVRCNAEPAAGPARTPRGGGRGLRIPLVAAVGAAVVVVALGALAVGRSRRRAADPAPAVTAARLTSVEVAARALPSTVVIKCRNSVASGFFVAPGQILTNAHALCEPDDTMKLRLSSGQEGTATVLRTDERLDLALLQAAGIDAPALPLGDAGSLAVGERVMVVGCPNGMEFSVSQGGVSNLDRVYVGVAMIQTDAPINPGNSGGPMLDEQGRVVGVVSLKDTGAEGISFVLPINYAFAGPDAMIAAPGGPASEGFARMMGRADAEDAGEAEKLQGSGQRPGMVGAQPLRDQTIAVEILWPATFEPGAQSFEFDLMNGTTSACALRADVGTWHKLEGRDGKSVLNPRVRTWLERHGFSSTLWVGLGRASFAHCPDEAVGANVVLKMRGADDDASEIAF